MRKLLVFLIAVQMLMSVTIAFAGSEGKENKPVIIGFKNKPDQADKHMVIAHGGQIKYSYSTINAIAAKLPGQAIDALKKSPNINYIENDVKVRVLGETLPWGVDRIDADIVHPYNKGTGVRIAIIDTGIDYEHPDLNDNYKGGIDLVNGDADPADDNGHGTHVAGTIAAEDNDFGVIGVAPEASLYGVKVLDSSGSGYVSDVISGIDWAVNNNIQIISMSLGADSGSLSLERACDTAYNSGILLIAAAGNDGSSSGNDDNVDYPARYGSVIAVAATDSSDNRASWSSTGPDVELAAPGVSIYSTYTGGGYTSKSGTSMATPHVSGAAALIFASDPTLTNVEVRQLLQDTADDLGTAGKDNSYGYGLVDADEAEPGTAPPVPDPTQPDTTPPGQVTGVTVTTMSSSWLDVLWNTNIEPDLDHYRIYRSNVPGFSPVPGNLVALTATDSYRDTGLDASTTYYYRVSAVDTSGNEGALSNEASGTTFELQSDTMHVASIDMSKRTFKARGWYTYALATVTVVDAYGSPVIGATVSGHWSGLTSDRDSGTTNSDGRITFNSDAVKNPSGRYRFTVDNVSKVNWIYRSDLNIETSDSINS